MSINYDECFTYEYIHKTSGRKAILYLDQNKSKFYRFLEEPAHTLKDIMYMDSTWGIVEEITTKTGVERKEVISVPCDEFSGICGLSDMIDRILETEEESLVGYTNDCYIEIQSISATHYWVMFWDTLYGYKFTLSEDELLELKKVVKTFTEYMIQNSVYDG